VLPLLPLPEGYLGAGPWGGLVYQDFPELTQVVHVLAAMATRLDAWCPTPLPH